MQKQREQAEQEAEEKRKEELLKDSSNHD